MTIPVYKGYDKFKQVGTVTINSDRITHVDISYSFPQPMGDAERYALYIMQGKEVPQVKRELSQDTQFPFAIKKLSKADFAYRNAKLTHELKSNDLKQHFGDTRFFIKPSFIQRLTLTHNLKKFYWQTEDFKTHIFKYFIASLIGSGLTIVVTNLTKKPCPDNTNGNAATSPANTSSSSILSPTTTDTQLHQPIHKTTKSLNDVSSVDTTTKQKTQTR
ncbi:hypothetical protein [Phnomibacter ginsenosidimutans]|uniref:Uncharacterized protein n=1 Tax=Phnomibacter ginsenosidimutans TaxID=2676868 RepID=A0A6I6GH50_9BACT|nr:hypothetical protein [Phnomibacter ginsenosidimutans]QGW27705.1 hypothetical protein GLV81_06025 [Phnomibacter ginsenosidimutans]